MISLGCEIWRELHYFAFLNMIRAGQVLGTPVKLAKLEHVEYLYVTSR